MPLRKDLTEKDKLSPWYMSFSHWGEAFINRESHVYDPEWEQSGINGVPVRLLGDGFNAEEANLIVKKHNEQLGVTDNVAPWMKFDEEHEKKLMKHFQR